jgi:3-dehydroquinate dehydratase-2
MSKSVLVISGPNLNRLGSREPDIYGSEDYEALVKLVQDTGVQLGLQVDARQSNSESEIIGWLQEAVDSRAEIVINPAAFTHYSYALRDAVALVTSSGVRVIEVHISNPHSREVFRHHSVISGVSTGVIAGFGLGSYVLALKALV